MATNSAEKKGHNVLDALIKILEVAENACHGIPPAQVTFAPDTNGRCSPHDDQGAFPPLLR